MQIGDGMKNPADSAVRTRYQLEIDCVACRGTGRSFRKRKLSEPCLVCEGTGRVEEVP